MVGEGWLKTLDDLYKDIPRNRRKIILVRPDLNSPVENGKILPNRRLDAHSETLYELANNGYKVVVVAHQGRPNDKEDVSLRQHAVMVKDIIDKKYSCNSNVSFCHELLSPYSDNLHPCLAVDMIKGMDCGEILFLENIRANNDEIFFKDQHIALQRVNRLVRILYDLCDAFVFDCYAAAHRSYPSTTGLISAMADKTQVYCGRVMQKEVEAIGKVRDNPKLPLFCGLGGAKPKESFEVAENLLKSHEDIKIGLGGVPANIFFKAQGKEIGKSLGGGGKYNNYVVIAEYLLDNYGDKILLPDVVAVNRNGKRKEVEISQVKKIDNIVDVGMSYVDMLVNDVVKKSKTVIMNGPFGLDGTATAKL
ncbi:MAG: phosphoglycerate kinase, partial [Candidatus Heimdallarchaeota archaeon]|nr:phosphoglycerate kinase [Candidatus Heimdallarchaeota archaeon]